MTLLHSVSSTEPNADGAVVVVEVEPSRASLEWADQSAADVVASTAIGVVLHLDACGPATDIDVSAVDRFLSNCAQHGMRTVVVAVDEDLRRRLVAVGIDDHSPVLYWAEDAIAVAGAGPGWR